MFNQELRKTGKRERNPLTQKLHSKVVCKESYQQLRKGANLAGVGIEYRRNHEKQACSHSSFFFWGVEFIWGAGLKFPPNAGRGERCGDWGRTAPINPGCIPPH